MSQQGKASAAVIIGGVAVVVIIAVVVYYFVKKTGQGINPRAPQNNPQSSAESNPQNKPVYAAATAGDQPLVDAMNNLMDKLHSGQEVKILGKTFNKKV